MTMPLPPGCPIRSRIRQQEDQVTLRIVTKLQIQPALEAVSIGDLRFGLDPYAPPGRLPADDLGVPRPEVPFERKRNLRPPPERRMEPGPEFLEECQLGAVSDRIAGRVRPDSEIEAYNRAIDGHKFRRPTRDRGSLESPHLRVRDTYRLGRLSLTEPRTNACLAGIDRDAA